MEFAEVRRVVAELTRAGARVWVGGGWGVDVLVGRQTRVHRDLDLALDASHETVAFSVLESLGYDVETDRRPVRVEFVARGRGWVDLHPVEFDSDGRGRQADVGGRFFDYPPHAFREGMIEDVRLPCLSLEQQRRFHSGYELRDVDRQDLRWLALLSADG